MDGSERKANVTSQNEVAVAVAVAVVVAVVVLRDRIYKNYGVPYGSLQWFIVVYSTSPFPFHPS